MTRDEIDILWQQAMKQAIEKGEMFTRYHFAALVAAAEREACAFECDKTYYQHIGDGFGEVRHGISACAAAIRARGQS